MDNLIHLKKKIQTAFKLSGFLIKSDSASFLCEQLTPFAQDEQQQYITKIIENLQTMKLSSTNVDKEQIELAVSRIDVTDLDEDEGVFDVISAFTLPRFVFNTLNKKFYLNNECASKSFLPDALSKSQYICNRYNILLQKTMRHELFSQTSLEGIEEHTKKFKLFFVENLLSQSYIKEVIVLGLLTQLSEGKYYLEDPSGTVKLDLVKAQFHSGFYCEGSFILVEGKYEDEILKATSVGFPPSELASVSRSYFGTQNSWGGKSNKLLKYSVRLAEIERSNKEATIVFLSDVRLDIPKVMEKLKTLFIGYDECPPVAIILMGPFCQEEKTISQKKQLFDGLGDLTDGCNHLKQQTELVLVPSQEDPAAPNILPRQPLPEYFVKDLRKKWKRLRLATNPCRIQYCTQQIVICNADIVAKLYRNTIHFPNDGKIEQHFARTLICQSTIAPINPIALPVYWDFDTALQLYPLPDLVVVGGSGDAFTVSQAGCIVMNTGSFIKSKFSFKVYLPSTRSVEDSEIPSD